MRRVSGGIDGIGAVFDDGSLVADGGLLLAGTRRNTDRRSAHRHAALCLATTVLIVGKLFDYRDRWSPP